MINDTGLTVSRVPWVIRMSVIVPCHNVERYVTDCLQSLARNAAPDIEFLLVDDASTDATGDILATRAARLPGATVLTLPQNRGLSAARNAGLRAARGRTVSFLDGDDVAAPGHFPALADAIDALRCDFVRTDHVQVRGRERRVQRIAHAPRGVVCPPRSGIGQAGRHSSIDAPYAWAGAYHRRLVDTGLVDFDEDLRTCEDRPWIWRLHLHADSFAVLGLRGVRYRREVTDSLTQLNDERQFDFIPAFERIIAMARADNDASGLLPKAVHSYCAIVCHHLTQLDRYPRPLRRRLRSLCERSLAGLPTTEVSTAVVALDPIRARTIHRLLAAW
jgi:glycosyltransferase involved in cell wall biosynthesis